MSVVAVTMVKDERDVIGFTLMHLLNEGVDRIVVADNLSTDGTYQWLLECAAAHDAITVVRDSERGYYQAAKMTALANAAAEHGDWVIPFDADEVWHTEGGGTLAEVLNEADVDAFEARPYVHVPTLADNRNDPNPFTRIRHRMDTPEPFPKVCVRWSGATQLQMGNHGAFGLGQVATGGIGVRHFQYRTLGQVKRKVTNGAAAYAATNLPPTYGTHWRNLAAMRTADLHRWWAAYVAQPGLVLDPAPFALCPR